ncbi:MAG: sigma-54-dependent Fis family transcriptional regulator [Acidobacteria bacterium]|nr:sigma-54-dependent Fis family transcriptional regulator [Acidobacteriota bacterium]
MSLATTTTTTDMGARRAGGSGTVLYVQAPHESGALGELLGTCGLPIEIVMDPGAAVRAIRRPDIVVAIVHLADERHGIGVIRALRAQVPHLPIAALMDPARPLVAADAVRAGVSDLLALPLDAHDLGAVVANALDRASVGLSTGDPPIPPARDVVVANSSAMRATVEQVRASAPGARGVVILGEPGTGRSLVARVLHNRSERAGQPFVAVDCRAGSLAELEMRLFGLADRRPSGPERRATERISKTGAVYRASSGTLFLQHVVEAPSRVQARLARLLRDREATLHDERTLVEIDLRPMASMDAGPDREADERVRRDLFERLAQTQIEVPPFRRRREDVPLVATWMLHELCERQGVAPKAFSRAALVTLAALPWPGNGPELMALLSAVVASLAKPVIQLEDLLEHVRLDGLTARVETGGTLRDARQRFEREWISSVLIKHHGRVGEAARALGIQRTNLYRKVRQLKVARTLLAPRKTSL